jgi:hypothetical protein
VLKDSKLVYVSTHRARKELRFTVNEMDCFTVADGCSSWIANPILQYSARAGSNMELLYVWMTVRAQRHSRRHIDQHQRYQKPHTRYCLGMTEILSLDQATPPTNSESALSSSGCPSSALASTVPSKPAAEMIAQRIALTPKNRPSPIGVSALHVSNSPKAPGPSVRAVRESG